MDNIESTWIEIKNTDDVFEYDCMSSQDAYLMMKRNADLLIESIPLFVKIVKHTVKEKAESMSLYYVYELMLNNLNLLIGSIHFMCNKLNRTLTYDYYDETKELSEELESLFNQFLALKLHQENNLKEYVESIDGCSYVGSNNEIIFCGEERIPLSLQVVKKMIEGVKMHFHMLFLIRVERSKESSGLVYRARFKKYQEEIFPEKWEKFILQLLDTRLKYSEPDSKKLKEICEDWYKTLLELPLGKCWEEYHIDGDNELAYQISKLNQSEEDMDIFFLTLSKYRGIQKWIEDRLEYESKGDEVFKLWVDVYELQQTMKFWVKGEMRRGKDGKTQEYWLVFWCVMKEMEMIRRDVTPPQFAKKMSVMFPDVEIVCKYESWRKFVKNDNHDSPIDNWNSDDKFLPFAQALKTKLLSTKKQYTREMRN